MQQDLPQTSRFPLCGWVLLPALACLLLVGIQSCVYGQRPRPLVFTQTGAVTALALADDGGVWAATRGGALYWAPGSIEPLCWTSADGLASNDLRSLALTPHGAWVANAHCLHRVSPVGVLGDESAAFHAQEIRAVATTPDACWIATNAGLYRRSETVERKLTDDVRRVITAGATCWAITTTEVVRVNDGRRWKLPDQEGNITALAATGDELYLATSLGLWHLAAGAWTAVTLPPDSPGSHVSALALAGDTLYAALYGDGLYACQEHRWTRRDGPPALAEVTALALAPTGLYAATRETGVWRQAAQRWSALSMPTGIPSADIYAVCPYHAATWASTFDQGLLCWSGSRWRQWRATDGLSTDSPRDLLVFNETLYARHTTGEIDSFDGKGWRKAFAKRELPRPGVYAMATDGKRLYLGLWAGWAATDGKTWEYHFHVPLLDGLAVTAIAADAGTVWVGTQKRGLLAFRGETVTQYHEAHGLTDDWITRLAVIDGRVLVGTYTGGLLEWTGAGFRQRMTPQGFAIHDICRPAGAGVLVATPIGVYQEDGANWRLLDPAKYGGLETQALCPVPGGLWVGSRAALARLSVEDLHR